MVEDHLGEIEQGILCVDRYAAYKKFAKDRAGVILAFCWTHQRRDFLKVVNSWRAGGRTGWSRLEECFI